MAKQIYDKYKEAVADSNSFSSVVSIIKGAFPEHPIEVNYHKKSFHSKKSIADSAILPIEGIFQPDGSVRVLIRLANATTAFQIQAIPLWKYLSGLEDIKILPLVSNANGSQELWIAFTIEPQHLGFIQQPRLLKTLEEIKAFADFLKESTPALQNPEINKMIDLYDKISYQFIKPFPDIDLVLPDLLKAIETIYPTLLSGNPVIIKHESSLVLEYIASVLASLAWKGGHHFGLLNHLLPYGQLLESIDKVTGIPVIPTDLLLRDSSAFNLGLCYKAVYQTGRSLLFLTTDLEINSSAFLNVYPIQEQVSLEDIIFNRTYQLSSDLSIDRLQKLSKEATEIIQPFYEENEKAVTAYLPSFCRQSLHLYQNTPTQLRNKLTANLFHHFD